MARQLKAVKDLSVLIVAPRRHDRQLWADLLKNCGINHPLSMSDITQAATVVGSGQADVVFVDESYGAQGIAHVLIPARNVEFAGGRGVCLVLCSKQATAADVLNARKLGFASLVILPASTDTIRKHLELAARYIPPSDEELGWSIPKPKKEKDLPPMPAPKDDPQGNVARSGAMASSATGAEMGLDQSKAGIANNSSLSELATAQAAMRQAGQRQQDNIAASSGSESESKDWAGPDIEAPDAAAVQTTAETQATPHDDSQPPMATPGRSGQTAEEEVVFL